MSIIVRAVFWGVAGPLAIATTLTVSWLCMLAPQFVQLFAWFAWFFFFVALFIGVKFLAYAFIGAAFRYGWRLFSR